MVKGAREVCAGGRRCSSARALWQVLALSCLAAVQAGETPSVDAVRRQLESAIRSGGFDYSVVKAIRSLPAKERVLLAARLVDSPHAAMRRQAVLMLRTYPPAVAGASLRKLLSDADHGIRTAAARYLAKEAKDPQARAVLLRSAADPDPAVATTAVQALGGLGGFEVAALLRKLLEDKATPQPVRLAAILAAGSARAAECTPALVGFLDDAAPRDAKGSDKVRVCDLAASALQRIHRVNYTGIREVYFRGPVEERDKGIARWKAWYAEQAQRPAGRTRSDYLGRLLEDSLAELARSPDGARRGAIRGRLASAFHLCFCLGDLPGVDAVVGPSVGDLWRILQVTDETLWYRHVNCWRSLETAYRTEFLPKAPAGGPDDQAIAFITFAEGQSRFPRIWVWSLCRNLAEVFPQSAHLPRATETRRRLEAGFRAGKPAMKVVLHGHTAVLEPVPRSPSHRGGMLPAGRTALLARVRREPSNWALHRLVVEDCRSIRLGMDIYPMLAKQSLLYPGNEYPYLGDAAYQSRVRRRPARALAAADKALILNPTNPKAHAIRGIIRVVADREPDAALRDLRRAAELDPASLGDEPETLEAAVFLIGKTLAAGDRDKARAYAKALGQLRAFRARRPLHKEAAFEALARRLGGP